MTPKPTDRLVLMLAVEMQAPVAFSSTVHTFQCVESHPILIFEVFMSVGGEDTFSQNMTPCSLVKSDGIYRVPCVSGKKWSRNCYFCGMKMEAENFSETFTSEYQSYF